MKNKFHTIFITKSLHEDFMMGTISSVSILLIWATNSFTISQRKILFEIQGGRASSPLYPGVLYKAGKALARSNQPGIYGNWASQESNEKILEVHWIWSSYKSAIF
jgi:hypothetical protein